MVRQFPLMFTVMSFEFACSCSMNEMAIKCGLVMLALFFFVCVSEPTVDHHNALEQHERIHMQGAHGASTATTKPSLLSLIHPSCWTAVTSLHEPDSHISTTQHSRTCIPP